MPPPPFSAFARSLQPEAVHGARMTAAFDLQVAAILMALLAAVLVAEMAVAADLRPAYLRSAVFDRLLPSAAPNH